MGRGWWLVPSIVVCLAMVSGGAPAPARGQSTLDRLKRAADDALRKSTQKQPQQAAPSQVPRAPANVPASSSKERVSTANVAASSARVETLVLAPADQGLEFYVSPRGGHVAAVTQRGSRFVVIHDGMEGPKFDEIIKDEAGRKIYFSPDGARHSYTARLGQEYVMMADGKELMRAPVATTQKDRRSIPEFTSNGKHVYFVIHNGTGTRPGDYAQLIVDGQPVPVRSAWGFGSPGIVPVFSPDGDHYAYLATNPANPGPWTVVVDGKPTGYQGGDPRFTADGRHLFTRTALPGGQGIVILLDGKPYIRARDARLYIPPAGLGIVAVVTHSATGADGDQFLVVNGKRVSGSEAANIKSVYFSPDGKRYAALCESAAHFHFMVVDGKKGQEYQLFTDLVKLKGDSSPFAFSPDSSRTAYVGRSGEKEFAVVDDVESDGFPTISGFSFGGGGKRTGFFTFGGSREHWIVVDGKKSQQNAMQVDDLIFSPDGSRYAYAFTEAGGSGSIWSRLVVDGRKWEASSIIPMLGSKRDGVRFLFSQDGKHVVHYGELSADRRRGFFIDGKYIGDPVGSVPYNPTFTPDGRHLLWAAQVHSPDFKIQEFVVFVDGRSSARFDFSNDNVGLLRVPGAWEMGTDGVLTFIAFQGNAIKRFRITAPEDTSIDTCVSSGTSPR